MNNIWYNYDRVLSFNALLNFIIGERGVGKTYGAKKYVVNRFLKKGKQFVYIRRYKTEIKKAMGSDKNPKFFKQIEKEFEGHKLSNKSDTMYVDGKLCGYAIPLSVANILKSSSFDDVDTIIFDEFIIDKGNYHYLQNEVIQFLDVIETVARLRDIRVILLGNAISTINPYFTFFNLSLPYKSDIKTFKNGLILVNYIKNEKYREIKKKTRFGQLIEGTEYGKYAIDNEFLRDNKTFIEKRSKNSKFYFILFIGGKKRGVWMDYKSGLMYISSSYDPLCPVIFTFNTDDHDNKTILLRLNTSPFLKSMIEHYRLGQIRFDNQEIKNDVMNYILSKIRS